MAVRDSAVDDVPLKTVPGMKRRRELIFSSSDCQIVTR